MQLTGDRTPITKRQKTRSMRISILGKASSGRISTLGNNKNTGLIFLFITITMEPGVFIVTLRPSSY